MSTWSNSRAITRQTWSVVKGNRYMLLFPVASGVLSVLVFLIVAGAGAGLLGLTTVESDVHRAADGGSLPTSSIVIGIVALILAAYLATLIVQIFMGGLVKAADEQLQGRDSSFGAGLSASFSRIGALLGWAAIQTAVGWLLSAVRGDGANQNPIEAILRLLLSSLLAVAWSIISFFVLPLIILRGKGPIQAIKESVGLIRSTWGMQVAGGVRIGGMIGLLAVLPGIVVLVAGVMVMAGDNVALGVPLATIGVIVLIVASVLISALRAVFSVALLHYAEAGTAIGPFNEQDLRGAVKVKAAA